ncbi:MAG: TIGR04100 family radical SAM protein [Oscillospiraceae bacterium]
MNLTYTIGDALYVNLTNRCPCACTFCIRNNGDGAYGSESLWLDREPAPEEVIADLKRYDLSRFSEIVYCGYGEPTEALDALIASARFIRSVCATKIRINTNGLSDLIHGKPTAMLMQGLFDEVSISLNAGNAATYCRVTNPAFGMHSFDAMLQFAAQAKELFPQVVFTVVDVISAEEIKEAQIVAENMGIPLRVRAYTE